MNIEELRQLCLSLPHVTEDIKWEDDLCFSVGGKMFCVSSLEGPVKASFKVQDNEFDQLTTSPGIIPAPYLARYKWVSVQDADQLGRREWKHYVSQSYRMVKSKLSKKILRELDQE